MIRFAAALAAALLSFPAAAREVEGVQVPDSVSVGGQTLALNGVGIRKKKVAFVKVDVYVGALYVQQRSQDAEAIVKADAPKQVTMTFLRDVDRARIMEAFKDGFESNSRATLAQVTPGLDEVAKAVGGEVKKGQALVVAYVPGQGTTVTGPGGKVTVPGEAFAEAMFRNWLGPKPTDDGIEALKKSMLGQ